MIAFRIRKVTAHYVSMNVVDGDREMHDACEALWRLGLRFVHEQPDPSTGRHLILCERFPAELVLTEPLILKEGGTLNVF